MEQLLDVSVKQFLRLLLQFLVLHNYYIKTQVQLYRIQVMVQCNMGHIFHLFPDLNKTYLVLNVPYVYLNHNRYGLQFPIILPNQMEMQILCLLLLYYKILILLYYGHEDEYFLLLFLNLITNFCRSFSNTQTTLDLFQVYRKIQVPFVQIHVF